MVTRSQARSRADREAARPQRPAIYCRISDAVDELGVQRQEKHGRRLGKARRWNMANARVYVDNDITAARKNGRVPERPDFVRLRADIQAGEVDGVLCYDLDRLLRDPEEAEAFYSLCERAGMFYILSEADDVDISTGDGLMVARIKAAVAAEEVRKIRQRVTDKKQERAEMGLPNGGGRRPFGWSCAPRRRPPKCTRRGCPHDEVCRRRLEERAMPCAIPGCAHDRGMSLVEPEADGLRRAAAMILNGATFEAAAEMLNGAGLPPSPGGSWDPEVLARVLRRPRMAGIHVYKGEELGAAAYPKILDRATWDALVAVMDRRGGDYVTPYRRHLLTGIAGCGECTHRMYAQVTTRQDTDQKPVVYYCKKERGGCGRVAIRAARLEDEVIAEVGRWLDDPELADEISQIIAGDDGADIPALEAQVAEAEQRLREIAREREERGLDWVEVEESRRVVKRRLDAARAQLATARRHAASRSPLGKVTVAEIAEEWVDGDPKVRREIIGALAEVTVRKAGRDWRRGAAGYEVPSRVDVRPVWKA